MKFVKFSKKQIIVLSWWTSKSTLKNRKGVICDGSVRAGKSVSMALSFIFWAMKNHNKRQFGMSGKTVTAFERNIIFWLLPALRARGYNTVYKNDTLLVQIKDKETGDIKTNTFYVVGGRDERSYTLIQGMTCAGWFFDEVALMPESFVSQALSRCSVEGSKYWFNCNPDKPSHWFKKDYIDKAEEKNLLYIHFTMADNPSLSEETKKTYENMFSGLFYLRYIKGYWSLAEGIIYDMFNDDNQYDLLSDKIKLESTRYFAIDYGTTNPFVVLDIFDNWDTAYQEEEIYYDSKETGVQKTDEQYAQMIDELAQSKPYPVEAIVIDPSAESLRVLLRNKGYRVKLADNEVLEGIKVTGSAFYQKKYKINRQCVKTLNEIGGYVWDSKAKDRGEEKPVKVEDHACITGNTLIQTTEGKIPIKDLVGKEGKCYCIDPKKRRKAIAKFKNVMRTGKNKKCYRIKLKNGKYIEATADHLVLTKKGWKRVDELKLSDKVVKINYVK